MNANMQIARLTYGAVLVPYCYIVILEDTLLVYYFFIAVHVHPPRPPILSQSLSTGDFTSTRDLTWLHISTTLLSSLLLRTTTRMRRLPLSFPRTRRPRRLRVCGGGSTRKTYG